MLAARIAEETDFLHPNAYLSLLVITCRLGLPRLVCKYMVGKPVDLEDVKCLDLDFYRQRVGTPISSG